MSALRRTSPGPAKAGRHVPRPIGRHGRVRGVRLRVDRLDGRGEDPTSDYHPARAGRAREARSPARAGDRRRLGACGACGVARIQPAFRCVVGRWVESDSGRDRCRVGLDGTRGPKARLGSARSPLGPLSTHPGTSFIPCSSTGFPSRIAADRSPTRPLPSAIRLAARSLMSAASDAPCRDTCGCRRSRAASRTSRRRAGRWPHRC